MTAMGEDELLTIIWEKINVLLAKVRSIFRELRRKRELKIQIALGTAEKRPCAYCRGSGVSLAYLFGALCPPECSVCKGEKYIYCLPDDPWSTISELEAMNVDFYNSI